MIEGHFGVLVMKPSILYNIVILLFYLLSNNTCSFILLVRSITALIIWSNNTTIAFIYMSLLLYASTLTLWPLRSVKVQRDENYVLM